MAEWNEAEARKVLAEVIKRGRTDPEFRALALRDPAAAIATINPQPLPPGFNVQVVEARGASVTVVLPDMIQSDGELSDVELEQVAGGKGVGWVYSHTGWCIPV